MDRGHLAAKGVKGHFLQDGIIPAQFLGRDFLLCGKMPQSRLCGTAVVAAQA